MALVTALVSFFSAPSRIVFVLLTKPAHSFSHDLASPFGGLFLARSIASSFHSLAVLAASSHFSPFTEATIAALYPSLPKLFFMTSLISASAAPLLDAAMPYEVTTPITPRAANTPARNIFLSIEIPSPFHENGLRSNRATVTRLDDRLYQTRSAVAC